MERIDRQNSAYSDQNEKFNTDLSLYTRKKLLGDISQHINQSIVALRSPFRRENSHLNSADISVNDELKTLALDTYLLYATIKLA